MSNDTQKKILIVDDDAVVLRTMKEGLSGTYKIFGANSGANALKILEKMPVDLVLLDYEMPEMNGPQVLARIRETPSCAEVPVLFLTGLETLDTEGLAVSGFLKKSLALTEIETIIANLLGA